MRSHNYFIFLLLSFFAYVNSANAVTVQSFNGPVTLNRDGTCTASGLATETRFDLTGTALSVLDTVNDGGGTIFMMSTLWMELELYYLRLQVS